MAALMVRGSILTEGNPLAFQPYHKHSIVSRLKKSQIKTCGALYYSVLCDGEADSSIFYRFTRLETAVPNARFIVK